MLSQPVYKSVIDRKKDLMRGIMVGDSSGHGWLVVKLVIHGPGMRSEKSTKLDTDLKVISIHLIVKR